MERASPSPIPETALEAVVDCLARSHDLVLLDMGRGSMECGAIRRTLWVATQSVRSLAATKASILDLGGGENALVIRKGGSVSPQDAARVVELELIAQIPTVADLARLADRGIPPTLSGGWKKACGKVLQWCLGEAVPKRRL